MNRDMKIALIDVSYTTNLAIVDHALIFAANHGALVSFFDTKIQLDPTLPDVARVHVSKRYSDYFSTTAFIGSAVDHISKYEVVKRRATDVWVISNLYSIDVVYPLVIDEVKLQFIAMPNSEAVEWFKGEYPWADVCSWQQAEDRFDVRK